MTKQEEIRKKLISFLWNIRATGAYWKDEENADKILSYLHSQGCVLKVDRELPKEVMYGQEAYTQEDIERFLFQAGYVAVKPLIKEE